MEYGGGEEAGLAAVKRSRKAVLGYLESKNGIFSENYILPQSPPTWQPSALLPAHPHICPPTPPTRSHHSI